jgi:CRP-like cAMP-binding protein
MLVRLMRDDGRKTFDDTPFGIEVTANSFDHLRRSRLFRDVETGVLERLAPDFRLERVATGTVLAEPEPDEARVAVIRRGRFHLEFPVGTASRIVTACLEPGDVLGVEALFGSSCVRSRALSEALLLTVPANELRIECARSSALAVSVAGCLDSRLREVAAALADLRYAEPARHVLAALVGISAQFGVPLRDGVLLDIALADGDIATIAACSETDTAPALRLLEREGFLRKNGPSIVLLGLDGIR